MRGVHDVGRGWDALRRYPELWKWLVAPAIVTLVILAAIVLAIVHFVSPVIAGIEHHLPAVIASIAGGLLTILIVAVLAIGGLFAFATIAGAIAGPFNEQLSEQLEAKLTGRPPPKFSFGRLAHEMATGAAHAIRRILVAIAGTIVVIAIGFVPGIGTLAAVILGFYFAARASAYDCYDAVLARRHLGYAEKMSYLATHRSRTLGLGAAVAGMLLIPGLNLVALGIGAAGATIAVLDQR
ncbi:MAG: EI24 domain-containing protein [Kofleriaceae bacterium]